MSARFRGLFLCLAALTSLASFPVPSHGSEAARQSSESKGPAGNPPLELIRAFELPHVPGALGGMAFDAAQDRLFVAASELGSVLVINLRNGGVSTAVADLDHPRDVHFVADSGHLVVTAGDTCRFFEADTSKPEKVLVLHHADRMRYDSTDRRLYVGFAAGALAAIDPTGVTLTARIRLDAHPGDFALESDGPRIFVNIPAAHCVSVLDRRQGRMVNEWHLNERVENVAMALDEKHGRLWLGCLEKPALLALDLATGKRLAEIPCPGRCTSLVLDEAGGLLVACTEEGFLRPFRKNGRGDWEATEPISTRRGTVSMLRSVSRRSLFAALPADGGARAEIREYGWR